jgi:MoaA/NifB/PqqE/SkfB family radical SAM enzyme
MDTCVSNEKVGQVPDLSRTIQIHPTRKCNLACLHCYSYSAPNHKEMLDINSLKRFLKFAYDEGFNNIAISGGEPFLYENLGNLLSWTKDLGYNNTLATNGMLLKSRKNQDILPYIDLLAVSIDGKEAWHDVIRAQKGAFQKMLEGVEILKQHGKKFGFIHTITEQSWEDLIWLGEFSYHHGAKLLQLHPLENEGRAKEKFNNTVENTDLYYRSFILAHYLKSKYVDKMVVQLDLLHREYIETFPSSVNGFSRSCFKENDISSVFDNIIIEETGRILPYSYGFNEKFAIGNIKDFPAEIFKDYMVKNGSKIKTLFDSTFEKVTNNKLVDLVNWNEILISESKAMA